MRAEVFRGVQENNLIIRNRLANHDGEAILTHLGGATVFRQRQGGVDLGINPRDFSYILVWVGAVGGFCAGIYFVAPSLIFPSFELKARN
jgi:hypothetical protein